ncbi:MAG: thymidylate synthase, partial [Bacilli bacterium]
DTYNEQMARYQKLVLEDEDFRKAFGDLGPVYGKQWRNWVGADGEVYDQIRGIVDQIKSNPHSRRLLVSAWNPAEVKHQQLPPCHYSFQFYVVDGRLSCLFNMRSTDVFLGLPFNIASYALLTHLIAHATGLELGELVYSGADVHIYNNHVAQVMEQMAREPRTLPTLKLNAEVTDLFAFDVADITLEGYDPHPTIRAEVAV